MNMSDVRKEESSYGPWSSLENCTVMGRQITCRSWTADESGMGVSATVASTHEVLSYYEDSVITKMTELKDVS